MNDARHTFTTSIIPFFGVLAVVGMTFYTAMAWLFQRDNLSWFPYTTGLAVIIVGSMVLAMILTWVYKVTLTPSGIKGFNLWGKFEYVAWLDITDVKRTNLLGLRYLRVYRRDRSAPVWIPLFVTDASGFRQAMRSVPTIQNPLSDLFAEPG